MNNQSFKENNKDLFEICDCEHTRSLHLNLASENQDIPNIKNFKNMKDKECNADNCICKIFKLKKS